MAITCPKCRSDNPETLKFCGECGTKLDASKSGHPPGPEDRASFTRTLETSTDELTRGMVFAGRYEIIEELGTGGMGRVYRAHDTKLNEEVALKLIKPEIAPRRGPSSASTTNSRSPARSAIRTSAGCTTSTRRARPFT